MKLLEFSYKNILSYGNKLQTFTFDDGPKLILVEGENGAGKSSIKEALTVSIYGRSAIRKMKDIPNWINKNAYTQVKFETTSGETIELDRGIDPNFSNIKINDNVFNLPVACSNGMVLIQLIQCLPFGLVATKHKKSSFAKISWGLAKQLSICNLVGPTVP